MARAGNPFLNIQKEKVRTVVADFRLDPILSALPLYVHKPLYNTAAHVSLTVCTRSSCVHRNVLTSPALILYNF